MAISTGLEGKPWYLGLIAGLVVAIGIYFAAHVWLLKPKRQNLERQEARLAELQAKIQEGRTAKVQLPRFREEVRRLELELEKLLRILPARRNVSELLRRFRNLAEQGDFELQRFAPGGEIEQDFYSEWPITVNLQGTYHNLALFFDRVGRFSRIINIENLRVTALQEGTSQNTIGASFQAKTFVYKESGDGEEGGSP